MVGSSTSSSTICTTAGANSCGMHGTGFLDPQGKCSATVPPDSACSTPLIDPSTGFYADPIFVRSGGASNLHWSASNATFCTVTGGGLNLNNLGVTGSTATGAITAKTVYTLTCFNTPGGPSASANTTVNLDPAVKEI